MNISAFIFILLIIMVAIIVIKSMCNHEFISLPLKESIRLVGLPVIPVSINGNKYNFIVDTGATTSIIDVNIAPAELLESSDKTREYHDINGNTKQAERANVVFQIEQYGFCHPMMIQNLQPAFASVKKISGATVHGILGSDFFNRFQGIIDFESRKGIIRV